MNVGYLIKLEKDAVAKRKIDKVLSKNDHTSALTIRTTFAWP